MSRGPRISYPNAVFHVINRFVDRHPFFQVDSDYRFFLDTYFDVADTFGMWTYAYDLMPNHFHFVLETPSGEISRFLQRFLTRSVQRLNRRHNRVGHLLQSRTKTLLIQTDSHFDTVIGYVLLNRVRAGLAKSVFSDRYNSAREMLTRGSSRIARGPLWEYLFGHEFNPRNIDQERAFCRKWLSNLDVDENRQKFAEGHHGAFLSTPAFRRNVLDQTERRLTIKENRARRKTDRHRILWKWQKIQDASRKILKAGGWKRIWRNEATAIRHIGWYVASVGAGWPYERIREIENESGISHSRYAMTVHNIRCSAPKAKLAQKAINLCIQIDRLTE